MNFLVTGGFGFIGSHFIKLLIETGIQNVTIIDTKKPCFKCPESYKIYTGDYISIITEYTDILFEIDTVVHFAWASIPESSVKRPIEDININLISTIKLVEYCALNNVKRFIFLSSGGAVYGIPHQLPIKENHPTEPISAYGISKLAVEKYLHLFYRLYGLEYAILRPSVPYGEYQYPFGRQGAVAVFFGKIIKQEPIEIWGNGKNITRDFFYVKDLVKACLSSATVDKPAEIYNIGSNCGIDLMQLLANIREVVGEYYSINFKTLPVRPFDVPNIVLDISKAKKVLDWQPETDLNTGLKRTWEWIRSLPK